MSLSAAGARMLPAMARVAAALIGAGVPRVFGYAGLRDYARERLGRSGRWLSDLARLHAHLERLPALRAALTGDDGGDPVHASAALALGGVATPHDVGGWIALARTSTLAGLRKAIRSRGEERVVAGKMGGADVEPDAETEDGSAEEADSIAPDDEPAELRFLVPPLVRVAFRETLDLYRAVEGSESSIASFAEALVAESASDPSMESTSEPGASAGGDDAVSCSGHGEGQNRACDGPWRGESQMAALRHGQERDAVESALARAAGGWRHLSRSGRSAGWALRLAGSTLARLRRVERLAGNGDARALDLQMRALLSLRNDLELRLGEVLHEMGRMGAWSRLGFADAGHYAERRLALSRTAAEDRMWVARAIKPYALVGMAYERGELGWEATRHILRVLKGRPADVRLQQEWIARGRRATVKRLGDEVKALQREAALSAAATAPPPMTDAAWHESLRREPGSARAVLIDLGEALVRQAEGQTAHRRMDLEIQRLRLPGDLARDLRGLVGRRCLTLRRLVRQVPEDEPWPDPHAPASVRITRIFSTRGWREPFWVGLLGILEDFVATWDVEMGSPRGRPGPRSRDEVFARTGYRCSAPGCASRRNLQEHHVRFRSRGGSHALSNRSSVCVFHHLRGIHEGLADCRGVAPLGLTWRLGREDVGEVFLNEMRIGGRKRDAGSVPAPGT